MAFTDLITPSRFDADPMAAMTEGYTKGECRITKEGLTYTPNGRRAFSGSRLWDRGDAEVPRLDLEIRGRLPRAEKTKSLSVIRLSIRRIGELRANIARGCASACQNVLLQEGERRGPEVISLVSLSIESVFLGFSSEGFSGFHLQTLTCEEKCKGKAERALEKFRFNLERKDWTLERDGGEEGITVKSLHDKETKAHFLFTEASLDFECDWMFEDLRAHTLEATADWYSDVKEYKVLQRLTDVCWVVYQVMEPRLGGLLASRDMVYVSHCRRVGEAHFISMCSTEWPGLEQRAKTIRAAIPEGSGLSISPDPSHHTTRTLLRWVMSLDMKIPLVPVSFLLKFHVEGCRQYVLSMRKYLSARQPLRIDAMRV